MQLNDINLKKFTKIENSPEKRREEAKLKEVCQEFESMLLSSMLTQMRNTVMKSKLFNSGQDEEIFNSMLDQERAKLWAKSDGIGLANILFQQMRKTL